MKLEVLSSEDGLVHIQCSGSISLSDVAGRDPLEELLGPNWQQNHILLKTEQLTSTDTSGVGWFIHNHKACKGAGRRFVIHTIPPMVEQILELLRMHELLYLASNEAQARSLAQGVKS